MKLIDQYMLSRFFVPFGICVAAFCMLFVIVDMFDHLSDFIEAGTPVLQVARFYAFYLPALVVYIMPISILLGLLYSLWQLTRRNELTAMRASGIGFARLTLPLLIFGFLAGILTGLVNETVAPWSTYWAQQYVDRINNSGDLSTHFIQGLAYNNVEQRRSWIIGKFDRDNFDMTDVTIHQMRTDNAGEETVHAGEAKWLDGRWWLFNVSSQKYDVNKDPEGPVEYLPRREMLDYNEQPADFVNEVKDPLYMSALEIRMYLKSHAQLEDKVVARLSVDMYSRLAMPWTCLMVCLFGIPCGIFTGRQGALMGIVAALATFFLFYLLIHFSAWLGKEQHLYPLAAAWLPNLVFLTVGLIWIRQLR